ncbi:hypothetical protein [Agromyces silvae]|uniref:hypothetical protein n=1 Tax=Agromyces silvae TaxID=3388266 RepID=UPI00280B2912|nr:hypothetical protein [Agromyces protaetiae]
MTAVATAPVATSTSRVRPNELWRIIRLHAVNPSVFFGIPWIILGVAWAVTMVIALIIRGAGGAGADMTEGFGYSWAVLSPQWYLVVVGVQAVAYTFSFALGFGATRRDFWLGTALMFLFVSFEMAVAIATLVQIELATDGWGIGAAMFSSLWYGQEGWLVDFYTTFALQLLVLFIGASATTVYMRWRTRGMLIVALAAVVLVLGLIAIASFTDSWVGVFTWFGSIGVVGVFTIVLGLAAFFAVAGFLVIRRATPR